MSHVWALPPQAELASEARSTLDLLSKAENLVLSSQGAWWAASSTSFADACQCDMPHGGPMSACLQAHMPHVSPPGTRSRAWLSGVAGANALGPQQEKETP